MQIEARTARAGETASLQDTLMMAVAARVLQDC